MVGVFSGNFAYAPPDVRVGLRHRYKDDTSIGLREKMMIQVVAYAKSNKHWLSQAISIGFHKYLACYLLTTHIATAVSFDAFP